MTYVVQHGESGSAAFTIAEWIKRKFEDPSQAFVFEALKNLFLYPWFKRAWIVQEVALAKSIAVHCGSFCFDWKIIERFANIFMLAVAQLGDVKQWEKSKFAASCILSISPLTYAIRSCDVLQSLKNQLVDSGPPPLATILRKMRRQNASNPRDKAYAALGIGPASEREHPALQPDYGLSMARVFIHMSCYLLLKYQNLDLFSAKALAPDLSPFDTNFILPSWVVDWAIQDELFPWQMGTMRGRTCEKSTPLNQFLKPVEQYHLRRTPSRLI